MKSLASKVWSPKHLHMKLYEIGETNTSLSDQMHKQLGGELILIMSSNKSLQEVTQMMVKSC
jgi:hypothetical protein